MIPRGLTRATLGVAAALFLAACDSAPAPAPAAPTQAASGAAADGVADADVATDLLRLHREALAISEVALERAANAEVRALAEKTQEDYKAGERDLVALLEGLGAAAPDVSPEPPTLPPRRGAEFDRAFLIAMADHLTSSVQVAESAAGVPSAEVKDFAAKHATAASETLAEVRDLQG